MANITMKQKNSDGTFTTIYPVTMLSNVLVGSKKLSEILTSSGLEYTGNAATATKLKTARKITLTGEVNGNVMFDGTKDVSINTTLKDVVTEPSANKILKLDSTGKFPVSAIPHSVEFVTYTTADLI